MPTFPQPSQQLPQHLNPFNPYHYALLTYWVFFRPSAYHNYLYQADPEVYRLGGLARFWRGLFVPAYRRLYLMLPIALLFTALLAAIALWFYRQGMTAGHTSWVNSVAISGNGQVMVTAAGDRFERVQIVSADATLKVWDLQQGKELHTLRGHDTSVNTVAVTQDGKIAVSGGRDRTLRVWDLNRGKSLKTLKGHRGWVTDLAILPNQTGVALDQAAALAGTRHARGIALVVVGPGVDDQRAVQDTGHSGQAHLHGREGGLPGAVRSNRQHGHVAAVAVLVAGLRTVMVGAHARIEVPARAAEGHDRVGGRVDARGAPAQIVDVHAVQAGRQARGGHRDAHAHTSLLEGGGAAGLPGRVTQGCGGLQGRAGRGGHGHGHFQAAGQRQASGHGCQGEQDSKSRHLSSPRCTSRGRSLRSGRR